MHVRIVCTYSTCLKLILGIENTDVHTYIYIHINRLVQMVKDSNSRFPRLKRKMYLSCEVITGVCLTSNHIRTCN